MSEEVRHLLRDAFDVAPVDPSLRGRVIASLPARQAAPPRIRFRLAPELIAALLVLAIVAGLVYIGRERLGFRGQSPAGAIAGCKLPMAGFASPSEPRFGFLNLSEGTFVADLGHSDEALSHPDRMLDSGGASYDRQRDVWLPVPPAWVSPDGQQYVYVTRTAVPDLTGELRIRDLVHDTDLPLTPKVPMRVIGWGPGGVYFTTYADQMSSVSVSVVNPQTRQEESIYTVPNGDVSYSAFPSFWAVGAGAVWGSTSNQVLRLDLQTRTLTTWYEFTELKFIGLTAAGQPIVLHTPGVHRYPETPTEGEPMMIVAKNRSVPLGDNNEQLPTGVTVVADGKRTWFSAQGQRMWLYTSSTGLMLLDESTNTALPNGAYVAGGCV